MNNKFLVYILFMLVISPLNLAENGTNKSGINQSVAGKQVIDFDVITVSPKEFKAGDAQLNILIKNTGTIDLKNVMGIISGKGFSTYDVIPIESLEPNEKGYIIVLGNFKEEGNTVLIIRVMDRVFRQTVNVINSPMQDELILREIQKEQEKEKELLIITTELKQLKQAYKNLGAEYNKKKEAGYDVSDVDINGKLEMLIESIEEGILSKDEYQANASLALGWAELALQEERMKNANATKKSVLRTIRENLLLVSALAASIITLFTFYELVKKKKDAVSKKLNMFKNDANKMDEPINKKE